MEKILGALKMDILALSVLGVVIAFVLYKKFVTPNKSGSGGKPGNDNNTNRPK